MHNVEGVEVAMTTENVENGGRCLERKKEKANGNKNKIPSFQRGI